MESVYKRRREQEEEAVVSKRAKVSDEVISLIEPDMDDLFDCVVNDGGVLPWYPSDKSLYCNVSPYDKYEGWKLPAPCAFKESEVLKWLSQMEEKSVVDVRFGHALRNVYKKNEGKNSKVYTITQCEGGSRVHMYNDTCKVSWLGGIIDATAVPQQTVSALTKYHCSHVTGAMQVVCSTRQQVRFWEDLIKDLAPEGTDVQCIGRGPSMSNCQPFKHKPNTLQFCLTTFEQLRAYPKRPAEYDTHTNFDFLVQSKFDRVVIFTKDGVESITVFQQYLVNYWTNALKMLVFTEDGLETYEDARDCLEIVDARVLNEKGTYAKHDWSTLTCAALDAVFEKAYKCFLRPLHLRLNLYRHGVPMDSYNRTLQSMRGKSLKHMHPDNQVNKFHGKSLEQLLDTTGIQKLPKCSFKEFVTRVSGTRTILSKDEERVKEVYDTLSNCSPVECCLCKSEYEPCHMVVTPCMHYACISCTITLCQESFSKDNERMFSCTLCRSVIPFNQLFVLYRQQHPTDIFSSVVSRLETHGWRHARREEARVCCGKGCKKCQGNFRVVSWNKNKRSFSTQESLLYKSIVVVTETAQDVLKIVHTAQLQGVYRLFLHIVDWLGYESNFEHARGSVPSPQTKLQEYCEKWMVKIRVMHVCEGDCALKCTLM